MMKGRVPGFRTPVAKPEKQGPEFLPHFWNPNRIGAVEAPFWFSQKLYEIYGDDIKVIWNPINHRWQAFARSPKFQHPVLHGWRLLFVHNGPSGEHLPLDERLLARLEVIDGEKNGGSKEYFRRIMAEMERDKRSRDERNWNETYESMKERTFDHWKISTAGKGNKFSQFHA